MTTKKPAKTIRDGNIKAVIWANMKEDETFYSIQFARTYKGTDDEFHDSDSFNNSDLLKVAHMAGKAYEAIAELNEMTRSLQGLPCQLQEISIRNNDKTDCHPLGNMRS